jgi:nitroreductase
MILTASLDALLNRESAVRLAAPAPDDAALDIILRSAVNAPDHGRLRPWRFIIVRDEARLRLGEVMATALARSRPEATPSMLDLERAKVMRAPLIVIVAAKIQRPSKIPDIEQILSAGAAAQNILLATHAQGFGAMWKTGANAYDDFVKSALGLEPSDAIVGFIYIGTSVGPPLERRRPDPEDFTTVWEG